MTPNFKKWIFRGESYDDGSSYNEETPRMDYIMVKEHLRGQTGDKYEGESKEGSRIKGSYTWPET